MHLLRRFAFSLYSYVLLILDSAEIDARLAAIDGVVAFNNDDFAALMLRRDILHEEAIRRIDSYLSRSR